MPFSGVHCVREHPKSTNSGQNEQMGLQEHKNENFFGFDFEICTVSLLVILKYEGFVKKNF
jgi:hypothetical protein